MTDPRQRMAHVSFYTLTLMYRSPAVPGCDWTRPAGVPICCSNRQRLEVSMAALRKASWAHPLPAGSRVDRHEPLQCTAKITEFADRVYARTGGATADLKRVYAAYLHNQMKRSQAG